MARKIEVQGKGISIISREHEDYISLTDIAKYRDKEEPFAIINNWMRSRSTIEFLGLWEKLSNPDFKPLEFERFRSDAGSNYFVLSPQTWFIPTSRDRPTQLSTLDLLVSVGRSAATRE
jgi:hypothetical protein